MAFITWEFPSRSIAVITSAMLLSMSGGTITAQEVPVGETSEASIPPGIEINHWACVDPDRGDSTTIEISPIIDTWAQNTTDGSIGTPLAELPSTDDVFTETSLIPCRFGDERDELVAYRLDSVDTDDSWTMEVPEGLWGVTFAEIPAGTYTLTEVRTSDEITSDAFTYDPEVDLLLNVQVRAYQDEYDWTPPADDPEDLMEVSFIPYVCDATDAAPAGTAAWYQSSYGTILADGDASQPASPVRQAFGSLQPRHAVTDAVITSSCVRADVDDVAFEIIAINEDGSAGASMPLFATPDDRIGTGWIPMGVYLLRERTTGTSVGTLDLVAGHDLTVLIYA